MGLFGLLSVVSSVGVMVNKRSIMSAINLILVFVNICGILICLDIDMLGLLLIVVYVGAVAVLFLFVIMLVDTEKVIESFRGLNISVYLFVILLLFFLMGFDFYLSGFNVNLLYLIDSVSNIEVLGLYLFSLGMFDVILVGFLLLVGIVGGVRLGLKDERL